MCFCKNQVSFVAWILLKIYTLRKLGYPKWWFSSMVWKRWLLWNMAMFGIYIKFWGVTKWCPTATICKDQVVWKKRVSFLQIIRLSLGNIHLRLDILEFSYSWFRNLELSSPRKYFKFSAFFWVESTTLAEISSIIIIYAPPMPMPPQELPPALFFEIVNHINPEKRPYEGPIFWGRVGIGGAPLNSNDTILYWLVHRDPYIETIPISVGSIIL